jgi:hypothetical protein
MPISVVFRPQNYTVDTHHQVLARLTAIGQAAPAGRLHHQALARQDGSIEMVVDVWESSEQLQSFAGHLTPILGELGVDPPEPQVFQAVLLDS